jgi:hypothetical protein
MGANHVELPDFVNEKLVEHAYQRAHEMQRLAQGGTWGARDRARAWSRRGINAAMARDARMLKFLDHAAEILRRKNDDQVSRFSQEGFAKQDYKEFALWREAYRKADAPTWDPGCEHGVFAWVYGACLEAVQ